MDNRSLARQQSHKTLPIGHNPPATRPRHEPDRPMDGRPGSLCKAAQNRNRRRHSPSAGSSSGRAVIGLRPGANQSSGQPSNVRPPRHLPPPYSRLLPSATPEPDTVLSSTAIPPQSELLRRSKPPRSLPIGDASASSA